MVVFILRQQAEWKMDSNLLTNVYVLSSQASYFELQAKDQISRGMEAALDHIRQVLLARSLESPTQKTRVQLFFLRHFPIIAVALVEYYHLSAHCGTWADRFFSLRLESTGYLEGTDQSAPLRVALSKLRDVLFVQPTARLRELLFYLPGSLALVAGRGGNGNAEGEGGRAPSVPNRLALLEKERSGQRFSLTMAQKVWFLVQTLLLPHLDEYLVRVGTRVLAEAEEEQADEVEDEEAEDARSSKKHKKRKQDDGDPPALESGPQEGWEWETFTQTLRAQAGKAVRCARVAAFRTYFAGRFLSQHAAFAVRILYLFGQTKYWTLSHFLMDMHLARDRPPGFDRLSGGEKSGENCVGEGSSSNSSSTTLARSAMLVSSLLAAFSSVEGFASVAGAALGSARGVFGTAVTSVFSKGFWALIYLVQLEQWYHSRSEQLQPLSARKMRPDVPVGRPVANINSDRRPDNLPKRHVHDNLLLPKHHAKALLQSRSLCLLCKKPHQNPAQSIGGYVFCYRCLIDHIQRTGRCPATGWNMRTDQVRRLRVDDPTAIQPTAQGE